MNHRFHAQNDLNIPNPDERMQNAAQNSTTWFPIFKLQRFSGINISMAGLRTVCDTENDIFLLLRNERK